MAAMHMRAAAVLLLSLAIRAGALSSWAVESTQEDADLSVKHNTRSIANVSFAKQELWLAPASLTLELPSGSDVPEALHSEAEAAKGNMLPPTTEVTNYRQAMTNFDDAQYVAYLDVGGQTMGAVLDTGSFEMVVFSSSCYSCGQAAKYSGRDSTTYVPGKRETEQSYGSGTAFSHDAWDSVRLGPFGSDNQTFWEVVDADMPVLATAKFNAVVGLGPPETPAVDAWSSAESAAHTMVEHIAQGIQEKSEIDWAMGKFDLAFQSNRRGTVLHNFGVAAFSICIGARPGADGYFVWNDTSHRDFPERFVRLPVVGAQTWTVDVSAVRLTPRLRHSRDGHIDVGCSAEQPCSAMIDSGTALLVVPSFAVDVLAKQANKLNEDCSNIQDLPELSFTMHGSTFTLPPDAYIGQVAGEVPAYMQLSPQMQLGPHLQRLGPHLHSRRLRNSNSTCELVVMESTAQSSTGPLFILGHPFLRTYYTNFDLGSTATERAIHVAPATEECTPAKPLADTALARLSPRGRRRVVPETPFWRRVEPSKMLMPHAVLKATTSHFVKV
mmetsp:Transcript_26336/g.69745  ORF Transcript_26336/g.69745 Transcript_26336/m.69745 type:complete len:554 (-) Transcript_26336:30-1691(-)